MHASVVTHELREEHELIREVLALVAELAAEEETSFETSRLAAHHPAVSEFLGRFADGLHHVKEEALLFTRVRHLLEQGDAIEQMLYEHELMRELRAAMDEAYRQRALAALVDATSACCEMLARHVFKENHFVYPMAERVLPAEEHAALREAYAKTNEHLDAPALRARAEEIRDALRETVATPPTQVPRGRKPAAR